MKEEIIEIYVIILFKLLKSGDYEINFEVINGLKDMKSLVYPSLDGLAEDDFIPDSTDHQKLLSNINNVIDVLQTNSCIEENYNIFEESTETIIY